MIKTPTMSSGPVAVVDALSSLVEAELNSLFRFMHEGSPYLSRATAEMRQPILAMVAESDRHAEELVEVIQALNGVPPLRSVQPEEQYLAYLSIKFLIPKLIADKKLMIERNENALASLTSVEPAITNLIKRHIAEHQADIAILEKAAADAVKSK